MGKVDFQVRMKSAAAMSPARAAMIEGELTIRLSKLNRDMNHRLGIPLTHTWAWAIVLETKGDSNPDRVLCGSSADTQTGALAMATEELEIQRASRARYRATSVIRKVG